jgi:hypothetical protein
LNSKGLASKSGITSPINYLYFSVTLALIKFRTSRISLKQLTIMKTKILFPAILFLLMNCGKEEDTTPEIRILTFSAEESFNTSSSDDWIIVQDESGETIDFRTFESNDEFIVETNKKISDKINVTFVRVDVNSGKEFITVSTHTGYPIGAEIQFRSFPGIANPQGINTGTFKVNVSLNHNIDQAFISNKLSQSCNGSGINNQISYECNVKDIAAKYLFQASDAAGNLRYKMLDNIKPDDVYNLTFDDLSEFDHVVNFLFPTSSEVFLSITAREPDQSILQNSYVLNFHYQGDSHNQMKAGYINSLSKYITNFQGKTPSADYYYYNNGTVPSENISWPLPTDFSVSSKLINNFSSNASKPYAYRSSSWYYEDPSVSRRITWTVYSVSPDHTLSAIPSEIVASLPWMKYEGMKYLYTAYFLEASQYGKVGGNNPETENFITKIIAVK